MNAAKREPHVRILERRAGSIERHVQTLIVIFIAGGVGWSVKNSLEGNDRMTRLEVTTQNTQTEVKVMSSDRWTASDAKRDHDVIAARLLEIEGRIAETRADHEARLRLLEKARR